MVKRFKEIKRFNIGLIDYSDADWADDVVSRRSTSGYMFKIGDTVVSWCCKNQQPVTKSSTKAEYVA